MGFEEYDGLLRHPAVIALLVVLVVVVWYTQSGVVSPVPKNLPWIGRNNGEFLASTRSSMRSMNGMRDWLKQGYHQYSKKGKSYNLPDVSGRSEVIIPNAKLRWLLSYPDKAVSVKWAHFDTLQGQHNFTHPAILEGPYHEHVVHKSLVRNIPAIIPVTQDEVESALDDTWGMDTENFRDIPLVPNMMTVIARASNRMFVGKPLCRNPDYTKAMGGFANAVITGNMLIPLFPAFLRPVVGPLITLPNQYWWWRATKYTIPLIKERKANMERKAKDPDFKWEAPNDYVTWHINLATAERLTWELESSTISRYLMPINFAAIHTTVFTITSTLFDLLSADPSKKYLEGIREEVERVFAECDGKWNKASLLKLYRTDSAIAESMRLSGFATRGLMRKVMAPEGITDPEEGFTVPHGGFVSTDVRSVHYDPEIYANPSEYDAFRFSRPIEEAEKKVKAGEQLSEGETLKLKQLGMVVTRETFLPWGHGKHACPGRFFVSHELKMLIGHMVMNYEVEHFKTRPADTWFGSNVIPDGKAALRLRRRKTKA